MFAKFTSKLMASTAVLSLSLYALPALGTSQLWAWTDLSNSLPYHDGIVTSIKEHNGQFLVSDGQHILLVTGTSVKNISNDPATQANFDSQKPNNAPSLSSHPQGCWTNGCMGLSQTFFTNGSWYFLSNSEEIRDNQNVVTQVPATRLYVANGSNFVVSNQSPAGKFASGLWSSPAQTLIATSDLGASPWSLTNLYVFDGKTIRTISTAAAKVGLTGSDTREIKAAYNGKSWMILLGKNLYRFDGIAFTNEGKTRDLFYAIAGSSNGTFLLGGAASTITSSFVSSPLTEKLSIVKEQATAVVQKPINAPITAPVIVTPPTSSAWSGHTATTDSGNGISSAAWLSASSLSKTANVTYSVAAEDADGISTIDLWVNGGHVSTCNMNRAKGVQLCDYQIIGADIKPDTMVYVNAKITDGTGKFTWTPGQQIKREADTTSSMTTATTTSGTTNPTTSGAQAYARSALLPNTSSVTRGTKLSYQTFAMNNTLGVSRIDVYGGGAIIRSCSFGAAVSEVTCPVDIDTTMWNIGDVKTYMVRMFDPNGHEYWGETRTVSVIDATVNSNSPITGFNTWSWTDPNVSELSDTQTATTTVGAWSPNGIQKIDMIADGQVRATCTFTSPDGNKECSYQIKTSDWPHGHIVTVNAKITDTKNNVLYAPSKSITIKHDWTPIDTMKASVTATTDRTDGYILGQTATISAQGGAVYGVDRIEIYANGTKVASCPTNVCTWTSPALKDISLEYSARLVDLAGRDVWTPVQGIYQK